MQISKTADSNVIDLRNFQSNELLAKESLKQEGIVEIEPIEPHSIGSVSIGSSNSSVDNSSFAFDEKPMEFEEEEKIEEDPIIPK